VSVQLPDSMKPALMDEHAHAGVDCRETGRHD
jgi:hypothetical protein